MPVNDLRAGTDLRTSAKRLIGRAMTWMPAELKECCLSENPEGAAEVEEDLGRFRSDTLNGMDKDSTRKRIS